MSVTRVKYPRTFNLPWSESNSSDDVWFKNCKCFEGKQVIVSEKYDGESTTIYPDGKTHARSVDSKHHPSRSWMKSFAATFAHEIPENHRICGENLFACHSIFYTNLPSYFLAFGVYVDDVCLSWADTESLCELLGIHTVPVLYRGVWDEKLIRDLWTGVGAYPTFESKENESQESKSCIAEGYVVRLAEAFNYSNFKVSCGKYVRQNHVKTDTHWMEKKPVPNLLAGY